MSEWICFLIFTILAGVVLVSGRKMRPLDAEFEIIEEDPCATCLRWSECNGVDDEFPLKNGGNRHGH